MHLCAFHQSDWFRSRNFQKQLPEIFYKKGVLTNLVIFKGKHMCQSLFLIKLPSFKTKLLRLFWSQNDLCCKIKSNKAVAQRCSVKRVKTSLFDYFFKASFSKFNAKQLSSLLHHLPQLKTAPIHFDPLCASFCIIFLHLLHHHFFAYTCPSHILHLILNFRMYTVFTR